MFKNSELLSLEKLHERMYILRYRFYCKLRVLDFYRNGLFCIATAVKQVSFYLEITYYGA